MTNEEILALSMLPNDAGAKTVRDYFRALLTTLWREGEGFSGKRPFGNSDWQNDIYVVLIDAEVVEGSVDDDGELVDLDYEVADKIILSAIAAL